MDSTARRVYYTLKRRKNNRPSKILIVRRLQSVAILARIPQALLLEQHNAVLFRMWIPTPRKRLARVEVIWQAA